MKEQELSQYGEKCHPLLQRRVDSPDINVCIYKWFHYLNTVSVTLPFEVEMLVLHTLKKMKARWCDAHIISCEIKVTVHPRYKQQ